MKQETLEETAQSYAINQDLNKTSHLMDFIKGAKWQEERSYSEEDMRKAFIAGFTPKITTTLNESFNKWFEQNKKI